MGEAETEVRTILENRSLARSHVIQAIAHDYELDFTSEIQELEEALEIDPEDKNVQNLLKVAQDKELQQLEMAYSLHMQGESLLRAGRLDEAMGMYFDILKFYPRSSVARYWLATIHFAKEEYVQAIEELTEALDIDPDSFEVRFALAGVYIRVEEFEEARTQLEEVLRIAPDFEAARAALKDLEDGGR